MKKLLVIVIAVCICLSLIACDRSLSPTLDDLLEKDTGKVTQAAAVSPKEDAPVISVAQIKAETMEKADKAREEKAAEEEVSEDKEENKQELLSGIGSPVFESMPADLYGSKDGITNSVLTRGENTSVAVKANEETKAEDENALQIKNETAYENMRIYTVSGSIFVETADESGNINTYEKNIAGEAGIKKLCFDGGGNLWFITDAGEDAGKAGAVLSDYFTGEKSYMTVLSYEMTPDEKCINDIKAYKNGVCVLTDKAFYTFDIKDNAIVNDVCVSCETKENTQMSVADGLCVFASDSLYAIDLKTGKIAAEKELSDIVKDCTKPIVYSSEDDTVSVILTGEGAARIDIINEGGRYNAEAIWQREDVLTKAAPVLSTANSCVYAYSFNGKEYGFDALNFETGESMIFIKVSALESYAPIGDITTKGNAMFVSTSAGSVSCADSIASIEESPVYAFAPGNVDMQMITDEQFLNASSRAYKCISPMLFAQADVTEPVTVNFVIDGFGADKRDCKLFYMGSDGKLAFLPSWNIKNINGPYLLKDAHIDADKKYILTVSAKDGSITDMIEEDGKLGICIVAVTAE